MKKKLMASKPVESSDSDSESVDSDTVLQEAFEKGQLKPGLNVEVPEPRKFTNNVSMMKKKLEDSRLKLEWVERLDLTTNLEDIVDKILADKEKIEPKYKVETPGDRIVDDLLRETLFYKQAQEAALVGLARMKALGIPTKRPNDYFAQMAKTDEHMLKVKQRVLSQQLSQEKAQKVKKLRELKKYGKKVQVEVGLQRAKEKRELLAKVKQYREGKLSSLDFLEENQGKKKNILDITKQKTKEHNASKKAKGGKAKKQLKDKKFGYGGKKSGSKRNNMKQTEAKQRGPSGGFKAKGRSNGKKASKGKQGNRSGKRK